MTDDAELLVEIENFLNASGVTATALGRSALNDPGFVQRLRNGRSPTLRTISKVRAFMGDYAAEKVERLRPYAPANGER